MFKAPGFRDKSSFATIILPGRGNKITSIESVMLFLNLHHFGRNTILMEMMAHHLHPPATKNGIRDAQKVKEFYLFGMMDIHLSHEKKPSYFPLYWLVNRDPYSGSL